MRFIVIGTVFRILLSLLITTAILSKESPAQKPAPASTATDTTDVGYLVLDLGTGLDSMYVVVDRNFESPHFIANGDSLALPAGERHLTIATRQAKDAYFTVKIQPGKVDTLRRSLIWEDNRQAYLEKSSYPVFHEGVNLAVVTDQESRVVVDERVRGRGVVRLHVSEGRHLVRTIHPKAGRSERIVRVQTDPPRVTRVSMYNKLSRRKARQRSVIPGLAQMYKDRDIEGISLLAGFGVMSIGAIHQHSAFRRRNQEYEQIRKKYRAATDEQEALRLGNKTERFYEAAQGVYWRRNVLAGVAAGIYLYSFLDAWLNAPEVGYRTPLSERTQVEPLLGKQRQGLRLVVRF